MPAISKSSSFCLMALTFGVLLCAVPQARAESDKETEEREDKEAEDEKKLIGQDFVREVTIKGKIAELVPLDENGNIPKVIGTIIGYLVENNKRTPVERTFLIKLKNPKLLRERIAAMGTKEIQLRGQLLNKEKYLLVSDVDVQVELKQTPSEGL